MALPSYSTGTVTVDAGGTTVTGSGTIWTGGNVREGDDFVVDGVLARVVDVVSATELTITKWTGEAASGAEYVNYQNSSRRVEYVEISDALGKQVAALDTDGFYHFVKPSETEPDPSLGDEGQYAFQATTGKLWLKSGGVWVFVGVYKGVNPRGIWSDSEEYAINDVVSLDGSAYMAVAANSDSEPPSADWMELGAAGAAATVVVGTTTTSDPGSDANVTNSGDANAAVLDFTIPRGSVVTVGSTTTGAPGSTAAVTDSGTGGDVVLDFEIPTGKGYGGTSSTDMTIGIGNQTFTIEAGLAFVVGDRVHIGATGSELNWMEGFVTAYNPATGEMTVAVGDFDGSGTFDSWGIGLTGKPGLGDGDMKGANYASEYAGHEDTVLSNLGGTVTGKALFSTASTDAALDTLGLIDLSMVPVASGVMATEVADFANDQYWLDGRNYPSLLSWLRAGDSIFAREGYAWKQDNSGRYFKVAPNTPRIISDGTGTQKGILIEGSATNRCPYSETFTDAGWTKTGCSFVADTSIATPDGTRYATDGIYIKMVEDTGNSQHTFYRQCTTLADVAHTVSIFVKAGTRNKGFLHFVQSNVGAFVSFDLATGTVGTPTAVSTGTAISAAIKYFGNGWYRVELTGKIGVGATGGYIQVQMANASGVNTYTGDGSSYMYVWGAQVVATVPATSYVPNYTSATNTRWAEFLYRYYKSQPSAITKIVKGRTPTMFPSDLILLLHIDDGTEANDFEIYRDTAGHLFLQLRKDWDEQATLDLGFVANDTDFSIAFRGSSADIAASINGGAVISDTISAWPSTLIVERYGINATEDRFWNSTIAYQATIPVAASDSELQALSS